MAKTKLQMQDISDVLAAAIEPFQAPPLVAAPFTTITDLSGNARRLPDPSKTIRPIFGIERVHTRNLMLINGETTSSGNQVWGIEADDRVRFVGAWTLAASVSGPFLNTALSDTTSYMEVTFYGTGLNFIQIPTGGVIDYRASVDGGAEGSNFLPTQSAALTGRNYGAHIVVNVVRGLSLGLHTVRIRKNDTVSGFAVQGFEIIGPSANINIPQGKLINNGRGLSLNALQTLDATSAFDVGISNGRGGRVVIYSEGNELKKALQPVDISPAFASLANHANEEVIRKINFREFGANRADDFSTLTSVASTRAFTLDDGTTTLTGINVAANILFGQDTLQVNSGGSFFAINFVGTGLDIVTVDPTTSALDSYNIVVDGVTQATGQFTDGVAGRVRVRKVVSGLPYGSHTVQFVRATSVTNHPTFTDFIIYGPKKPTLPEGAVEIGEYYLLADFVRNTFTTNTYGSMSTGVLRKAVTFREGVYTGTWTVGSPLNLAYDNGTSIFSTTNGATASYTFFGTGFDFRLVATNTTGALNVSLNGTALNASYPGANSITVQTYGGPNFGGMGVGATALLSTAANNTLVTAATPNNLNSGFVVRNLPLGLYTVTFTKNSTATTEVSSFDIITSVHFPNDKVGSLSMGPGVAIKQQVKESNVDLSKAKAWLVFDGVNQVVLASSNISAVLRVNTGEFLIYFEKPFKTSNFAAVTSATKQAGNAPANTQFAEITGTTGTFQVSRVRVTAVNGSATYNPERFSLLCFGELEEEGN